jgi:hypothetical protein
MYKKGIRWKSVTGCLSLVHRDLVLYQGRQVSVE